MESRKKRSLLARIDGQLAALDYSQRALAALRWQRIGSAVSILRHLPLDASETVFCNGLERRVLGLRDAIAAGQPPKLLAQRATLVRLDGLLWQMYLRRGRNAWNDDAVVS